MIGNFHIYKIRDAFYKIIHNFCTIGLPIILIWLLVFPATASATELTLEFGQFGSGQGEFDVPSGIEVDNEGNILIADRQRNRIIRFNSAGEFVNESAFFFDIDVELNPPLSFDQVNDIAIDDDGNIYAANEDDAEIVVLDSDFNPLFNFGGGCVGPAIPGEGCSDPDGDGPLEIGDGEFNSVGGIAFDSSGKIIVLDQSITSPSSNRVQVFDLEGNFLSKFGTGGSGDGQFQIPSGVDVDASGNIYVADTGNDRIQVFNSDGIFQRAFGTDSSPGDVAVDLESNIYVAESNGSVQIFDSLGNSIENIAVSDFSNNGIDVDILGSIYVTSSTAGVRVYSSVDLDGDGLLNVWETDGLDTSDGFLDLPLLGADPLHKDIFIEFDWMTGEEPTRAAIQAMKDAFAAAPIDAGGIANPDGLPGINLWVDTGNLTDSTGAFVGDDFGDFGGGNELTPDGIPDLTTDADGNGTSDFNDVKNDPDEGNFDPRRRLAFHYGISAQPGGFGGGWGERGGNDFIEYNHDPGTIMHELGHNLNLQHGGDEQRNCKPNYVSVMNYDNQFGILQTRSNPIQPVGQDLDGNGILDDQIIDFSPPRFGGSRGSAPLSSLIENDLDESLILDSSDPANQFVFTNGIGQKVQSPLNGDLDGDGIITPGIDGVDWDGDGDTDENSVAVNIDTSGLNGRPSDCTNNTIDDSTNAIAGYNDWDNVVLNFRQFGAAEDADRPIDGPEPDLDDLELLQEELNTTDLELTKTASSDLEVAVAGQELVYTLTVTNNGPNPARDVVVTDNLPAEVTPVSNTGNCEEDSPGVLTCNLGEILNRQTREFEIRVRVAADIPCPEDRQFFTISNSAMVENLSGSDSDSTNNRVGIRTQILCIKYEYSAKLVCGTQQAPENLTLARGLYATTINVHNPNDEEIKFFKKLALTSPPQQQKPGAVIPIAVDTLQYDEALAVDCQDIEREAFADGLPEDYIEGFVVVQSPRSLDVTAVYTAASLDRRGNATENSSIDVEQIKERIREQFDKTALPDLVVRLPEQTAVDCPNGQGSCVHAVVVEVENQSDVDIVNPFQIEVSTSDNLSEMENLPSLDANTTKTLTTNLGPGTSCYNPNCEVKAVVDVFNTVDESNESNNEAQRLDRG